MKMLKRYGYLSLLFLLLSGCMTAGPKQADIPDKGNEQLYIDAAYGFFLTHPQDWHKQRVTPRSQRFQPATLYWQVGEQDSSYGSMTVTVRPRQHEDELSSAAIQALLAEMQAQAGVPVASDRVTLNDKVAHISTWSQAEQRYELIIVQSSRHLFMLKLETSAPYFETLSPQLREVAASITELQP